MQEIWVWSLGEEDPLEKGMATHSSILAWSIPWTELTGGLQSMGSQRVGHNWATNTNYRNTASFWPGERVNRNQRRGACNSIWFFLREETKGSEWLPLPFVDAMTTVIICHFQTVLGVRQGNCPHHSEEGSTEMEGERMNFCDGCIIKEARIPNPQHFNLGGEGSILLFLTLYFSIPWTVHVS